VVVIGGGITGALLADALVALGAAVVLVDRRAVASGSTSASTALLQYELDVTLTELAGRLGLPAAVRCYWLAYEALRELEWLIASLGDDCGYRRRASLYLASRRRDVAALVREYEARCHAGFSLELLDRPALESRFALSRPAALRTPIAGQVDVYRLTHRLIQRAETRGLRVHDDTEVIGWEGREGHVTLTTAAGQRIRTGLVVAAAGYESARWLPTAVARIRSTYALASQPLAAAPPWLLESLVWETARPYLYAGATAEGNLVAGGEDDFTDSPARRDRRTRSRCRTLRRRLSRLLPVPDVDIATCWSGTFGETADGLPFIGRHPQRPGAWFALGYGGNGITFAMLAARLLRAEFDGHPSADAGLVAFSDARLGRDR
jgi:glycine/D-amino acid oxidase-like deaminating enzyme